MAFRRGVRDHTWRTGLASLELLDVVTRGCCGSFFCCRRRGVCLATLRRAQQSDDAADASFVSEVIGMVLDGRWGDDGGVLGRQEHNITPATARHPRDRPAKRREYACMRPVPAAPAVVCAVPSARRNLRDGRVPLRHMSACVAARAQSPASNAQSEAGLCLFVMGVSGCGKRYGAYGRGLTGVLLSTSLPRSSCWRIPLQRRVCHSPSGRDVARRRFVRAVLSEGNSRRFSAALSSKATTTIRRATSVWSAPSLLFRRAAICATAAPGGGKMT